MVVIYALIYIYSHICIYGCISNVLSGLGRGC